MQKSVAGILLTLASLTHPAHAVSEPLESLDAILAQYKLSEAEMLEGDLDAAIELAEPLIQASGAVTGEASLYTARLLQYLATLLRKKGDVKQAEALYLRSLEIVDAMPGADLSEKTNALTALVMLYLEQHDHAGALVFNSRLLAVKESQFGSMDPEVAYTLVDIALSCQQLQHWDDAETAYLRALEILEKGAETDYQVLAAVLNNLARLYKQQGAYHKAHPLYGRALALLKKRLGDKHPDVAAMLNNIADLYHSQGDYDLALKHYRLSLAVREETIGSGLADHAPTLNSMAVLEMDRGDFTTARRLLERAVTLEEQAAPDSLALSSMLSNLALLNASLQDFDTAESGYKRALAIREKLLGDDHSEVAVLLNNLATLYQQQAKDAQATPLLERALAITERRLGLNHPQTAASLNNLAALYQRQGLYDEAVPLFNRSLAIKETMLGKEHPDLTAVLANLAGVHLELEEFDKAESIFGRALSINEKVFGKRSRGAASMLNNLAALYERQGEYARAEPMFRESLAIRRSIYSKDHYQVAVVLNNLAALYAGQKKFKEAGRLYREALAITLNSFGERHPDTARAYDNLGYLYLEQAEFARALPMFRNSMAVHAGRQLQAALGTEPRKHDEIEQNRHVFRYFLQAAWHVAEEVEKQRDAFAAESYLASQWLNQTGAEAALAQMSARFASGDDRLSRAVRDYQDRLQEYARIDDAWLVALGADDADITHAEIVRLRETRDEAGAALTALAERLQADFPDYMELASPQPLAVDAVRSLLQDREAIVHFAFGTESSFVFLVTGKTFLWKPVALSRAELEERVRRLRTALDPTLQQQADGKISLQQAVEFDLDLAHELYRELLGPVEDGLEGIEHLYFVPSDALTSLPPSVLVTDPPKRRSGMRANSLAAWLIKRHAITVLPSVSSRGALRRFAGSKQAAKPFAGIGNPLLGESASADGGQRGVSTYFDGGLADIASIKSLGSLPQTEREIRQLASLLGAAEQDLYLGEDANETAIKQARLEEYRTVGFATHGLLAGELDGQAEPGLVLTPPETATQENDGLLSASEVARMRFNADWVILSACNTAAGDTPGAEGLSGLARAFFHAGARTLLVSHWPVGDKAALQLTTGAIQYLQKHPDNGKSEAFRQSMLKMIGDRSSPWNAHPRTWAPFVVVGEN